MTNEFNRIETTEAGNKYLDWAVTVIKRELGVDLTPNTSQYYQFNDGETKEGWEIKHDRIFDSTRRWWIEVGEKAAQRDGDHYRAGIFSPTRPIRYCVGSYNKMCVFKTLDLQNYFIGSQPEIVSNGTRTSRAFFVSEDLADRMAVHSLCGLDRYRLPPILTPTPLPDGIAEAMKLVLRSDLRSAA